MNAPSLSRRLAAESLGTGALVATVVGSGIMAERLAGGNVAVALLANALATGAGLAAYIVVFGPVSGAHFNPAVTLAARLDGVIKTAEAAGYVVAQIAGGVAGTVLANAMFGLPAATLSTKARDEHGLFLSEITATAGLLLVIAGTVKHRPAAVPFLVAAYIVAAYWFTASTSFANPAVTVARMFTDTFAGIRPADAPAFIIAQLIGVLVAWPAARWWFGK